MATVLVIDDNEDVREMLGVTLQLEGHHVRMAGDGQEALNLLRAGLHPCVILLDLMMPVMNGWEFRAAVDADPELQDLPIVVISACGGEVIESTRPTTYLPKPIDIDKLLDVVCTFCAEGRGAARGISGVEALRRE